jgi:hypothetical protein
MLFLVGSPRIGPIVPPGTLGRAVAFVAIPTPNPHA